MHLFRCLSSSSMNTSNSLVSSRPQPSSDTPAGIRNSKAGSGASSKSDSGRDQSSAAASNGKTSGKSNLARDLRINFVTGDGICGILYKWVNYGKGWRPRWFVLQDGVLSYYKIHEPDKIVVNKETVKGLKVIGDESMKWIHRQHVNPQHHGHHRNAENSSSPKRRKAVGEIHLKVSSIQESGPNDKKFSIFTGTKWLHLRAESRDDKTAWMEAFQAVKEMLPRILRNELMVRAGCPSASTEKLRQRLLEEGLNETTIWEVEQIMKNEFGWVQNQLILLNQRHWLLKETIRQLKVHAKHSRKSLNSYISVPSRNCAH